MNADDITVKQSTRGMREALDQIARVSRQVADEYEKLADSFPTAQVSMMENMNKTTAPVREIAEMSKKAIAPYVDLQGVVTENIRSLMRKNHMKQIDLAQVLGLSKGSVAQKLTNRISWTLPDISRMAQFFEIAPYKLFVGPVGLEPTTGGL